MDRSSGIPYNGFQLKRSKVGSATFLLSKRVNHVNRLPFGKDVVGELRVSLNQLS